MSNSTLHSALQKNLDRVEERIRAACTRSGRSRDDVTLVAVTKTVSIQVAQALCDLGVRRLGESRPQELWRKAAALPRSVEWHLIGHLQTNKVERTMPLVAMIHSVDRAKLLRTLEQEAHRQNRALDILLQINASRERQKQGFSPQELPEVISGLESLQNVRIRGLMTMAALEDNPEKCRPPFAALRALRDRFRAETPPPHSLDHLSMGMSDDYEVAVEEGATMIRLGSTLFADVNTSEPEAQAPGE